MDKKRIFIQKIQDLPTIPATMARLIDVAEKETSTASDLARVISTDQSMTSTVLRIVNSAFYGHMRQVSSISHAIVILGFKTVKALALGVSVFGAGPSGAKSSFDRNKFWVHSVGVATFAVHIAEKSPHRTSLDSDTVFLAGLIHDIGKVVFDNFFNDEYVNVVKKALDEEIWIGDVEMEIMGINHCEAGRYLADKWKFPASVIDAIDHHHAVGKCPEEKALLPAVISVADYLCRRAVIGSGGDNEVIPLDPDALRIVSLTEEALEEILVEVCRERESIEAFTV